MRNDLINILILSVGTNACFHLSKIFKMKFADKIKIIGADINEKYLIPSCNHLDKFYKVPYNTAPEYYETIMNICKNEGIDYILPSFDKDLLLFYDGNPDLNAINTKSLGISKDILKIYADKRAMNEFLSQNNLLIPKLYKPEEIEPNKKYFIKPIVGAGSIGAAILTGAEIITKTDIENFLIQEICHESEFTTECFYYKNVLKSITRERIVSKSGVCTKTKIFFSEYFHSIAEQFALKLKVPLYFNLQFMKNSNNEFVITDVNLRLAGGMSLAYSVGWDEASAIANVILQTDSDKVFRTLHNVNDEFYVTRAYQDIITKKSNLTVAFDLDGTLINSKQRHFEVLNFALKKLNIKTDFTESELINFKSRGKNNVDFLISKGLDKKSAEKVQNLWIKNIEDENFLKFDILNKNAIEILEKYKKENDLILITARNNKENTLKQLENLDIKKYFKDIFIVSPFENVVNQKANILIQNGAKLMIGDTKTDFQAAQKAKIEFLFAENGFHKKEILF